MGSGNAHVRQLSGASVRRVAATRPALRRCVDARLPRPLRDADVWSRLLRTPSRAHWGRSHCLSCDSHGHDLHGDLVLHHGQRRLRAGRRDGLRGTRVVRAREGAAADVRAVVGADGAAHCRHDREPPGHRGVRRRLRHDCPAFGTRPRGDPLVGRRRRPVIPARGAAHRLVGRLRSRRHNPRRRPSGARALRSLPAHRSAVHWARGVLDSRARRRAATPATVLEVARRRRGVAAGARLHVRAESSGAHALLLHQRHRPGDDDVLRRHRWRARLRLARALPSGATSRGRLRIDGGARLDQRGPGRPSGVQRELRERHKLTTRCGTDRAAQPYR